MAKKGDTVVVHYRGMLKDGKEFDSSEGREPLQLIIGAGSMIPGFEKAVSSMQVGETKTVTIKSKEAYGPVRRDLILEIKRDKLPPGLSPKAGDRLQTRNSRGGTSEVKVVKVTDASVTVDANHELAGQDLIFTIKMVAIKKEK
jgi:peptidylprolyl isomerase